MQYILKLSGVFNNIFLCKLRTHDNSLRWKDILKSYNIVSNHSFEETSELLLS